MSLFTLFLFSSFLREAILVLRDGPELWTLHSWFVVHYLGRGSANTNVCLHNRMVAV